MSGTNGTRRSDVVVIGGGLAGMTAAAYAARAGATVTVLEARHSAGGRARSTTDGHGVVLNQGAHALYRHGGGWDVLTGLGIRPRGGRPPTSGMGWTDGELRPFPTSPAGVTAGLFHLDTTPLLAAVVAARTGDLNGRSTQEWIDDHTRNDHTRGLAAGLCRVASYAPPHTLCADAGVRQMRRGLRGVRYLDGGWQQLVDALSLVLDAVGVIRILDAKVTAVDADGSGWSARTADATFASGAVVIAGTGPATAIDVLTGAGLDAPAGWAQEVPAKAAVFDIALRRLPRPRHRFVMGLDQPLYQSTHTPTARLAPEGVEVIHSMRYLSVEEELDAERDRREMEQLLDVSQPGWREELISERYLRNQLVSGGVPTAPLGLRGRQAIAVADHAGLFVAGDWVGSAALLGDAALTSGRAAGLAAAMASTSTSIGSDADAAVRAAMLTS